MLIELHASLLEDLNPRSEHHAPLVEGLENIAHSRREGKHILSAGRDLLGTLVSAQALSPRAKQIFATVLEGLPTERAFFLQACRRLEVVSDTYGSLASRVEGQKIIVQVPISLFRDSELVQRTVLLGENLLDTDIFLRMAQVAAIAGGLGIVPLAAEQRGGGGDTTADEYEQIQTSRSRLCVAVVDSDRQAPGAKLGSTAKRISRVDDELQPLSELHITAVRELENVLPVSLLGLLSVGDAGRMNAISRLEQLEASAVAEAVAHLDMKLGTSLKTILALPEGSPEREYWNRVASVLGTSGMFPQDCLATECCETPRACSCWFGYGFGPAILAQARDRLSGMSVHKIRELLCQRTLPEWLAIGDVVLAWCCASRRIVA